MRTSKWLSSSCRYASAPMVQPKIGFQHHHLDHAKGQNYWKLYAYDENTPNWKVVGHLDYSDFDGKIYVDMIFVNPEMRRLGIGTAIMRELERKAKEENMEVVHGMQTDEGAALVDSLNPIIQASKKYRLASSKIMMVKPSMLYGWRPKVEKTVKDLQQGRLSHSPGEPLIVSKLDSIRGGWFVMDGHHRGMEMMSRVESPIPCIVNPSVPFFERPIEANQSMTSDMVRLEDASKELTVEPIQAWVSRNCRFSSNPWEMSATGPEYARMSIDELDKIAFGFSRDEIKTLMPSQLHIKWQDDYNNVIAEQEDSGLNKITWAKRIDLSEPINVVFENGQFKVDDGYHRWYAASILGKPLNVSLEIKDKPHRVIVERALREGKPVPPEVLMDYPDLMRNAWVINNCKFAQQQSNVSIDESEAKALLDKQIASTTASIMERSERTSAPLDVAQYNARAMQGMAAVTDPAQRQLLESMISRAMQAAQGTDIDAATDLISEAIHYLISNRSKDWGTIRGTYKALIDLDEHILAKRDNIAPQQEIADTNAYLIGEYGKGVEQTKALADRVSSFLSASGAQHGAIIKMTPSSNEYGSPDFASMDFSVELSFPGTEAGMEPSMTVFTDETGKYTIDDVLEWGDKDFFSSPLESKAYFGMVDFLRTGKMPFERTAKFIRLYRGMSIDEYVLWERGTIIPAGKFFTRKPTAEFAMDISGSPPELFSFMVRDDAVVQTDENTYQLSDNCTMSGKKIIPVESPK